MTNGPTNNGAPMAPDGSRVPDVGTTTEGRTALQLQILMAEHSSLLATRSLAWNESFSRASMFLSTLSGVIVALALVGQGSAFGEPFLTFAIVLLPIALFVGATAFIRMGASNYSDALCVVGMNRIRAGYLELAPELERFFVTSRFDDAEGIDRTMASPPGASRPVQFVAGSPTVVAILDAVIVGALAALIGLRLGLGSPPIVLLGLVGFVLAMVVQAWYAARSFGRVMATFRPVFPNPSTTSVTQEAASAGD